MATGELDDDERNTVRIVDGNRGNPNVTVVNTAGLYALVFKSRKPEARASGRLCILSRCCLGYPFFYLVQIQREPTVPGSPYHVIARVGDCVTSIVNRIWVTSPALGQAVSHTIQLPA